MKIYFVLAAILIAFIVGAAGGYYFEKSGIPAQITDQKQSDIKVCDNAQGVTKNANDTIQKDASTIATALDSGKLQHPATCVRISGTPRISNGGAKHANADGEKSGISTDWLRSYAAQCETYRSEVNVCTDFLTQERQLVQPQ